TSSKAAGSATTAPRRSSRTIPRSSTPPTCSANRPRARLCLAPVVEARLISPLALGSRRHDRAADDLPRLERLVGLVHLLEREPPCDAVARVENATLDEREQFRHVGARSG